jgi:hypothetical protein
MTSANPVSAKKTPSMKTGAGQELVHAVEARRDEQHQRHAGQQQDRADGGGEARVEAGEGWEEAAVGSHRLEQPGA